MDAAELAFGLKKSASQTGCRLCSLIEAKEIIHRLYLCSAVR